MYCVGFIPFNFVLASVKVPVYRTNDNGTLERVGTNVEGWVHGHCIDSNQKIQDEIDSVRASLAEIRGSGGTKGTGEGTRLIPGTPGKVTGGSSTKLGKNMFEEMGLPKTTKRTPYEA
ncbi:MULTISPECIES: hypothetical protein [Bacillus cereus group]|uniref:hypothetical protein n=1 Tax=Bacillus cereus group TaxID=86661 RepID=UPI001F593BC6|nr:MULTISPECIES: hypothetical protein [unclassified Bacillus cereus group]MCM0006556.1 hypothetical protein [Bacillus paranthracis]MDA1663780.1 hypothetical protein [Bacillus cereus group sp. TH153LC]MDA1958331.1 hypothetical protein [Bacillus cereus group sp. BcHK114]